MTTLSVSYNLTEEQMQKLLALTDAINAKRKTEYTPADIFKSIMLTGSGSVIDERLEQTEKLL